MFHNRSETGYEKGYVKVRMPLTRRHVVGAMGIYPFYMDVMPPAGSHSFDLPEGRSERFWEGSPAIGGRILGISGHMHKYGVALRLEDRTNGSVIWEGKPGLDEKGEVMAVPIKPFGETFDLGLQHNHPYPLTQLSSNTTATHIVAA